MSDIDGSPAGDPSEAQQSRCSTVAVVTASRVPQRRGGGGTRGGGGMLAIATATCSRDVIKLLSNQSQLATQKAAANRQGFKIAISCC